MYDPPDISESRIVEHLSQSYGLRAERVTFLPLGADYNTAVYRVDGVAGAYFFKLRKGNFEAASLLVPQFLFEQGVKQVIPPIQTAEGALWSRIGGYSCALYPFIEGREGWGVALSPEQWAEFGSALRRVHSAPVPGELRALVRAETFGGAYRTAVRAAMARVEGGETFTDPVSAEMAALMRSHRAEIYHAVERAETLAEVVQRKELPYVLCHADIHAGNLLVTEAGGLYIVDWDNPVIAPKERDLMFIGAGIGGLWDTQREAAQFYEGYGAVEVNRSALAYYRYERIVEDYAAYIEEVLLTEGPGEDRRQGLRYFASNFDEGGVLEIARKTEP